MEKHLKRTAFFLMLLCTLGCVCFATPLIAVGTAEITGQTAKVPIELSGNTGICGLELSVQYNSALQLVKAERGEALSTMYFSKTGELSANPFRLGWDNNEEDTSNGIIAYLTFSLPDYSGDFSIDLSYQEGGIIDGDLQPVDVKTVSGNIFGPRETESTINVTIGNQNFAMRGFPTESSCIYTAFYSRSGNLISVNISNAALGAIKVPTDTVAKTATVFWLDKNLRPICESKRIQLK